jgi:hypothetical protein
MNAAFEADAPKTHDEDPSESVESDNTDSHDDSGSGTLTSNQLADQPDAKIDLLHLKREEKQVRKARYMLAIATLLFAVTVTVAVFFSGSKDEYRNFDEEVRLFCKIWLLIKCEMPTTTSSFHCGTLIISFTFLF